MRVVVERKSGIRWNPAGEGKESYNRRIFVHLAHELPQAGFFLGRCCGGRQSIHGGGRGDGVSGGGGGVIASGILVRHVGGVVCV